MEDAFLDLYKEFKKLQMICSKQGELLHKLLSNKECASEMPVSKPIQCTDKGDVCSESPFFRLKGKEDQCIETSKTMADNLLVPAEPKENCSRLSDLAVQFPPYNIPTTVTDKEEAAVGMSCADIPPAGVNANFAMLIKDYSSKFLDMDNVEDKKSSDKLYSDFLTPLNIDGSVRLLNVYEEDISFLQSYDISFEAFLEPQKVSNGVRGPAKSSWSPGCLSEDCPFGQRFDVNSDVALTSQICDFCQAVFPAGAATEGEFLGHLAGHIE
ncbi:hypothetical protein GDO81_005037 [Engystomops pustulosus]|uniref:Tbk1/Ikki binding domain-containing protein n=2 Tax=Engystomops pustulosus TaxID=76066 RepID=A0AAV7CL07_ENGPU|nr:hypothetical protein GDO81_005037 [Engystomops pustulosus]KAG8585464.1 hypothetical protein GDO81_005037 [Engystomops pustulosus]KAG8585465.1 hypothetical protein GDO81_005037 [Engystomops pustulosus]KAG8585466.1 hypothetical protein GDO81_005037 [Engystomops pustulosus]